MPGPTRRPNRLRTDRPLAERRLNPRAEHKAEWRRLAFVSIEGTEAAEEVYQVILRKPDGTEEVVAEVPADAGPGEETNISIRVAAHTREKPKPPEMDEVV